MLRLRTVGLVLLAVAGSLLFAAAATAKKKPIPQYYGHATASGQWMLHWDCLMDSYTTSWQMEALYGKTVLEDAGELDETIGGASGVINYQRDSLCNGMIESGSCSISQDSIILPLFLDKVPGGLRVDFQLSLAVNGCGTHQVGAYGQGTESFNRQTVSPSGIIPKKKIGKKRIVVPISGSDSGTATGRSFSGTMSGTLVLTKKKPLLALSF